MSVQIHPPVQNVRSEGPANANRDPWGVDALMASSGIQAPVRCDAVVSVSEIK
jgi:hypothetical protein